MKRTVKGLQEEIKIFKVMLKAKEDEIVELKKQYENMSNATYQTATDNKDLKSHWTYRFWNWLNKLR